LSDLGADHLREAARDGALPLAVPVGGGDDQVTALAGRVDERERRLAATDVRTDDDLLTADEPLLSGSPT
jgi:hypothetical protein